MIDPPTALQKIAAHIVPGGCEHIPLERAAGRILREDLTATSPSPPFDRVMMDGVAMVATEWHPGRIFPVISGAAAGHAPPTRRDAGCVVKVSTGGVLPPGCDSVVPKEWLREAGGGVRVLPPDGMRVSPGGFIHGMGSDGAAGRVVLENGSTLGPCELAIAATEGAVSLRVNRVPRVALITTGDEVVAPDQVPGAAQIRGSHGTAIPALLRNWGDVEIRHTHVADDADAISKAVAEALENTDMLLLAGGVSMGDRDFVPAALAANGVERIFHRVSQRPGKPLWFGMFGSIPVFGLPGNPNSALVCARIYAIPALAMLRGGGVPVSLRGDVAGMPPVHLELTCFIPLRLTPTHWQALPPATSGSLHALAGTRAIAESAPDQSIHIHPWRPI